MCLVFAGREGTVGGSHRCLGNAELRAVVKGGGIGGRAENEEA
jgi:hypothetical protein